MKVLIDGVEWWPKPTIETNDVALKALDLPVESEDAGANLTIRDYLQRLLETLWEEGEGFSGKRPFGNSGWEYDLYVPLVKAGLVSGKLDEEGFFDNFDRPAAEALIFGCIRAVFRS